MHAATARTIAQTYWTRASETRNGALRERYEVIAEALENTPALCDVNEHGYVVVRLEEPVVIGALALVYRAVLNHPGQTAIGLRDALQFPRTTKALENVQAALADLVAMGLVARERTAGMSTYTVAA